MDFTLVTALGTLGLLLFAFLPPKVKVLVCFFLLMQCFDLAPNLFLGMYVWDYGAILMLFTALELFLRKPRVQTPRHGYLVFLYVFLAWLAICLIWSLLVYRYPLVHTLKNARGMVLGYFMTLVFIRLFAVQPDSFQFLMKWLYRLTLVLMPVVVVQYLLQKPLLFGLIREYEGALRAVPIFLPLCLLNLWIVLTKLLSGDRIVWHEWLYLPLAFAAVALTFTRGIYIAFVLTACLLLWTMLRDGRLKFSALPKMGAIAVVGLAVLLYSGVAQKIQQRALSGLQLLGASEPSSGRDRKDDTFSGRLGLVEERFSLVGSHNPLIGYGFIHEDDVPRDLRARLKYGTVLGGTADDPNAFSKSYAFSTSFVLGFYTADIAWADIVISTGYVGVFLLIAFVTSFVYGHYRNRSQVHPLGYAVQTGLLLQVVMMFILTFNGNNFYGAVHIPALLFAGYGLSRPVRRQAAAPQPRAMTLVAGQ